MRLRTSTTRRVATAGLALATASALVACSSDDEEAAASDAPQAPVQELVLAEGEAPGSGVVRTVEPAQLQEAVDRLVDEQNRELMDTPACDRVSRLETVSNFATTDGVTAAVHYKQSEEDDTVHRFGIGMVGQRLDDFMDRSLYEACENARSIANPNVELFMYVEDAPAVDGAEGFRVISDFVTTNAEGVRSIDRAVSLHGFARDTTVSVEYSAHGDNPELDPVLPTAAGALDEIYTAQMTKLVGAE